MQDSLPENLDGLLIGGGYPEVYARTLSQNQQIRARSNLRCKMDFPALPSAADSVSSGGTGGEDGASYPMVGFLKGKSFRTEGLRRLAM